MEFPWYHLGANEHDPQNTGSLTLIASNRLPLILKNTPQKPWFSGGFHIYHGSLNVPIEHHPTIRYMVYNSYYKVMSNIPKMGHLPTPVYSGPSDRMGLIGRNTRKNQDEPSLFSASCCAILASTVQFP